MRYFNNAFVDIEDFRNEEGSEGEEGQEINLGASSQQDENEEHEKAMDKESINVQNVFSKRKLFKDFLNKGKSVQTGYMHCLKIEGILLSLLLLMIALISYIISENSYNNIGETYTLVRFANERAQSHHRALFKIFELRQMHLGMREIPPPQQFQLNK